MLPRIDNGVKFLLLLLFTFQNVSSRSHSKQLKPADVVGSSRLAVQDDKVQIENKRDSSQVENTEKRWENPDQKWVTSVLGESVTSSSRDDRLSKDISNIKQLLSFEKILKLVKPQKRAQADDESHENFLSRLLKTKNGPVVVFLTPGTDMDLNAQRSDAQSKENFDADDKDDDSDEKLEKYVAPPGENDAYVLFNVLRTTQEDEDLDPKTHKAFEKTKDVLRQAFALRCGAKNACEQKCPEKKPKCPMNCQKEKRQVKKSCQRKCDERPTCEKKCVEKKVEECEEKVDECQEKQEKKCQSECQETYDELDACPKPKKKTCGPKCGKTMPPYWLLREGDFNR
ncbi:hypothetical protein O0L34_g18798 [Tuta absoluta]|nr:hypothetical protein O0L34_g18798 [Tuta absoluta]